MIHDKDYIIRIIRQFSDFLSGLLLGKNEGERSELDLVFETQMQLVESTVKNWKNFLYIRVFSGLRSF